VSSDLVCCHVNQVGCDVVRYLGGDFFDVVGRWGSGVGASLVLSYLVHVSLGHCIIDGDVVTSSCCS
jgi:hypothetical protein